MINNPHSIKIHCDGAMDYDKNHTGGNGFVISFPDHFNHDPIERFLRRDQQGIHQLEMISILEGMDELIKLYRNRSFPRCSNGVSIFTDRFSVPDLLNPYVIREYRKNGWKNHEGKPIKDSDLINRIDKTRNKLIQTVGGRVEIYYIPRKTNRIADKLSKAGKKTVIGSKKIILKKNVMVARRLFDGPEITYSNIKIGDILYVRVYSWEAVDEMFEITSEIYKGNFFGNKLKIYGDIDLKHKMHRYHYYKVKVGKSNMHHILIDYLKELKGKK